MRVLCIRRMGSFHLLSAAEDKENFFVDSYAPNHSIFPAILKENFLLEHRCWHLLTNLGAAIRRMNSGMVPDAYQRLWNWCFPLWLPGLYLATEWAVSTFPSSSVGGWWSSSSSLLYYIILASGETSKCKGNETGSLPARVPDIRARTTIKGSDFNMVPPWRRERPILLIFAGWVPCSAPFL